MAVRGLAHGSRRFLLAALGGAFLCCAARAVRWARQPALGHRVRTLALKAVSGGRRKRAGLATVVGVTAADTARSAMAGSGAVAPQETPRALGERGLLLG